MWRSSRAVASAPSRSALFTTKMSPISRMPALAAWIPSPIPGASSTIVVSASPATSTSDCPTPTVSTRTGSQPAASRTRTACGVVEASPPRWPREAMERMKTSGSVACSCIRIRSPSRAPPENGEDGSTASTPTRRPAARNAATSAEVVVDFPTPGEPVSPTMCAPPDRGARAAIRARSCGAPSSTSVISRPTERGSPARARSTSWSTSTVRATPYPSPRPSLGPTTRHAPPE